MTVAPELAKIYASGGPDVLYYETLEFNHPNFTAPWYLTTHPEAFTARLETGVFATFQPYPIDITLPTSGENGTQEIQIAIANVERTPVDQIELASANPNERIRVTYRAYAQTDLQKPGMVFDDLSAAEIVVTGTSIVTTATAADLLNRNFPSQVYTTQMFPALYHV